MQSKFARKLIWGLVGTLSNYLFLSFLPTYITYQSHGSSLAHALMRVYVCHSHSLAHALMRVYVCHSHSLAHALMRVYVWHYWTLTTLTHSLAHSLTHSLTPSHTHSLTHSLTHTLAHAHAHAHAHTHTLLSLLPTLSLLTGCAFTRFQTIRLKQVFPTVLSDQLISYGPCQFPTLGFVVERVSILYNMLRKCVREREKYRKKTFYSNLLKLKFIANYTILHVFCSTSRFRPSYLRHSTRSRWFTRRQRAG